MRATLLITSTCTNHASTTHAVVSLPLIKLGEGGHRVRCARSLGQLCAQRRRNGVKVQLFGSVVHRHLSPLAVTKVVAKALVHELGQGVAKVHQHTLLPVLRVNYISVLDGGSRANVCAWPGTTHSQGGALVSGHILAKGTTKNTGEEVEAAKAPHRAM